jgi:hypothetical protein
MLALASIVVIPFGNTLKSKRTCKTDRLERQMERL